MKVVEGDPSSPLNKWPLLLDTDSIKSVGVAWLFKENGKWRFLPRITGNESLFYNAVVFFRFSLPLGLFFSVRWSGSSLSRALAQFSFGWKLNGRWTMGILWMLALALYPKFGWHWWYLLGLFAGRIQSDKTSAEGVSGPNYGQATGFNYGTH